MFYRRALVLLSVLFAYGVLRFSAPRIKESNQATFNWTFLTMPKTAVFTTVTPLPAGITRKSVLDMYKDHLAMIDLNPLVVERYKCKPPNYAPTSEYYATWYTIKDKVSYLPGGLATGSVSYHAVFHDYPDRLETHVYAPLGLDIRARWSVGGSLPGEHKEPADPRFKAPREGLYIREEVKMTCSSLLLSFVKKTFKDSHSQLVEKLVERAHILESNLANERLKALRNVAPRERMDHGDIFIAPPPDYPGQFAPPPYRAQPSPRFQLHARSQSASPVLTPRLAQYSLNDRSASVSSLPAQQDRRSSSPALSPKASSAPEQSLYMLPATTYDGGLSSNLHRPVSLYPGAPSNPASNRVASVYYETLVDEQPSDDESDEESGPVPSHIVSPPYIPEVRPISFDFAFDQRSPGPKTPISNADLLADIDAAIDESYIYISSDTRYDNLPTPNALQVASNMDTVSAADLELLPATTYTASPTALIDTLPSTTHTSEPQPQTLATLPSTTYSPEPILPSTTYAPKHERKDSVMPYHTSSGLPPVPPKDEKYRKPSQASMF